MKRSFNGIDYYLIDPTGNITILAESDVPASDQPDIANMLMKHEHTCEQVGFIGASEMADIGLRMAAGEFCGNAVMSAAALFCHKSGPDCAKKAKVTVECSGCDEIILVDITCEKGPDDNIVYTGSVFMPKHKSIQRRTLVYKDRAYDLTVVDMNGILHVIAKEGLDLTDEEGEEAIRKWCTDLNAEAMGLMQIRALTDRELDLRPLVYVPAVGTCFWESSCASGTTAVGVYLADGSREIYKTYVHEPGGDLEISLLDGRIVLTGTVNIM
ncbi:MAG: hypothetical protein J5910_01155 [Lachnospiraceae bacterium]|nr:hypothetical protein [Lachnospiraceae bacterium]